MPSTQPNMLSTVESARARLSRSTERDKKSRLGQFLTPARTASFMASLFPLAEGNCRLLDAGAGIGSLSSAFLERCAAGDFRFDNINVAAFELDEAIQGELRHHLDQYLRKCPLSFCVTGGDFIEHAVNALQFGTLGYTHAILNPPYQKIGAFSRSRLLLRQVGIETVNLYSAFVALAVALSARGGQIVAIIPRSFCNGPYYRPFRDFVLERAAIRRLHLFGSRSKAFRDDEVLQENVIIHLECGAIQGPVTVSCSTDDRFEDLATHILPFREIVSPTDPERFIHIPTSTALSIEAKAFQENSLTDLGIQVSTGPVVDFRLREHLRDTPDATTVPLLYPAHFSGNRVTWPLPGHKKPNAILSNNETRKWLYPNGYYCVVRRFSAKEEKRRIVASVVSPDAFPDSHLLGFENHLNVFHQARHGIPQELAHGLAAFLNSTAVDEAFRRFSGHTQVNATDLRLMKYPNRQALSELGSWAMDQGTLSQEMIDDRIGCLRP